MSRPSSRRWVDSRRFRPSPDPSPRSQRSRSREAISGPGSGPVAGSPPSSRRISKLPPLAVASLSSSSTSLLALERGPSRKRSPVPRRRVSDRERREAAQALQIAFEGSDSSSQSEGEATFGAVAPFRKHAPLAAALPPSHCLRHSAGGDFATRMGRVAMAGTPSRGRGSRVGPSSARSRPARPLSDRAAQATAGDCAPPAPR